MKKTDVEKLLSSLTIEQKIGQLYQACPQCFDKDGLVTGVSYLGWLDEHPQILADAGSILNIFDNAKLRAIQEKHLQNNPVPIVFMADIINGYRVNFPISVGQGCSFNPSLTKRMCEITANDASRCGISVTFSPMVDVSRDARWGRVSESYGEDPLLNADFGEACVKGYQGDGVEKQGNIAACVKHVAAYGATSDGRDYYGVEMSERTLRQTYLKPYERCVKAGAEFAMPAFNTINGIPCTANKKLLKDIMRDEFGFKGIYVSDYGAVNGICREGAANSGEQGVKEAVEAGIAYDMVDESYPLYMKSALEKGLITIEQIDELVLQVLEFKNKIGILDNPYKYISEDIKGEDLSADKFKDLAIDSIYQSSVLLKNDNNILPLKKDEDFVVIGPYCNKNDLVTAWGRVTPHRNMGISIEQALYEKLGRKIDCYLGSKMIEEYDYVEPIKDEEIVGDASEYLLRAVNAAKKAKTVVMTIGEHSSRLGEAKSKTDVRLDSTQRELFDKVYEVNQNIVLVLFNGRPIDICDISSKATAILEVWFPGTFGAEGIVNMLFGDAVPSGKLSVSFPQNSGQCPIYYAKMPTNHYNEEGFRNGYCTRWIDVTNHPLYEFGFGLSYTEFEYGEIKLSSDTMTRNGKITASIDVKNIGEYDAYETVQMYIHDVSATLISRPVKELKGYQKQFIKKGETKTYTFEVDEEMLKFYDVNLDYISENGEFEVYLSSSSRSKDFKTFSLID